MTTFVLPCLLLIAVSVYYANGGPPRRRIEISPVFGHAVDEASETDCPWNAAHVRRCEGHCYMEGRCALECDTEAATRQCHCSYCGSHNSHEDNSGRDREDSSSSFSSDSSSSSSDSSSSSSSDSEDSEE